MSTDSTSGTDSATSTASTTTSTRAEKAVASGHSVGTEGDSFSVAFGTARDGLLAAVDGQRRLGAAGHRRIEAQRLAAVLDHHDLDGLNLTERQPGGRAVMEGAGEGDALDVGRQPREPDRERCLL